MPEVYYYSRIVERLHTYWLESIESAEGSL
jgi:hypothetical protein